MCIAARRSGLRRLHALPPSQAGLTQRSQFDSNDEGSGPRRFAPFVRLWADREPVPPWGMAGDGEATQAAASGAVSESPVSPVMADNDAHDALNGENCQVDDRAETVIASE